MEGVEYVRQYMTQNMTYGYVERSDLSGMRGEITSQTSASVSLPLKRGENKTHSLTGVIGPSFARSNN